MPRLSFPHRVKPFTWPNNDSVLGIEEGTLLMPDFILFQNSPNPFNDQTTIRYQIGKAMHVMLKVYDMQGREQMTLADEYHQPGTYTLPVSSRDYALKGGIYYYRITAGSNSKTLNMVCIQ